MMDKDSLYDPLSDKFKRQEYPFYWIAQVDALYSKKMERLLKKVDMDIPRWRIIMILKEHAELSISEIANHAVAKLPTTTKIIYRMQKDGMVNLSTSPEDGRVTLVSLTDKGMDSLNLIRGSVSQIFHNSFIGLEESQIKELNILLMKLYQNLRDSE